MSDYPNSAAPPEYHCLRGPSSACTVDLADGRALCWSAAWSSPRLGCLRLETAVSPLHFNPCLCDILRRGGPSTLHPRALHQTKSLPAAAGCEPMPAEKWAPAQSKLVPLALPFPAPSSYTWGRADEEKMRMKAMEANKTIARKAIEEIRDQHNREADDVLYAPRCQNRDLQTGSSAEREAYEELVHQTVSSAPDAHLRIDAMLAKGDRVAVCYGVHNGNRARMIGRRHLRSQTARFGRAGYGPDDGARAPRRERPLPLGLFPPGLEDHTLPVDDRKGGRSDKRDDLLCSSL